MGTWWLPALSGVLLPCQSATADDPPAAEITAAVPTYEDDAWSPPITFRVDSGLYATAIHVTLLPDARLLFLGYARLAAEPRKGQSQFRFDFTMEPTPLGAPAPAEVVVDEVHTPVDLPLALSPPYLVIDDLFCSGHTLTGDGDFFTAGGQRSFFDLATGGSFAVGLSYATPYDGTSWDRLPAEMLVTANMPIAARWYPHCTRLADGRILVVGGYDLVDPVSAPNLSAEVYDPGAGTWQVVSPHGQTPPAIANPDYTHAFLLPAPSGPFEVLAFGGPGRPVLLAPGGSPTGQEGFPGRPGTLPGEVPNIGASSALLPIRLVDGEWGYANGSVLVAGAPTTPRISTTLTSTIRSREAGSRGSTSVCRDTTRAPCSCRMGGSWSWGGTTKRATRPRGGRDQVTDTTLEKTSFQYYSPSYLGQPRPILARAPEEIRYGRAFQVTTVGPAPAELVLLGLGSMTHSIDMNQRYVQLEVLGTAGAGRRVHVSAAVAPPGPQTAPPGPYMLFALDGERVPSVARIVMLR